MLEICKIKESYWLDLKKKALEYDIQVNEREILKFNGDCLVILEHNTIVGFGYYEITDGIAWVKQLEIFISNEQERELYKDFLFRALMNAAELRSLEFIRVDKKALNLEAIEKMGMNLKYEDQDIVLDIKECFKTACSCKR